MIPQTQQLHTILVHYGADQPTATLIDQILTSDHPPDSLIVIDHSQRPFKYATSSTVHVVRPTKNHGYAGGINFGLGYLKSLQPNLDDIVVIFNNDLKIAKHTFTAIRKFWRTQPAADLVGLSGLGHVDLLTGRAHLSVKHKPAFSFSYLHGAAFMAPYATLLNLSGVPDQYFLYWEDVALTLAARRKHKQLATIDQTGITHIDAKATYSDAQTYYLVRNGALVLAQKTPLVWRIYWKARNLIRLIYHRFKHPNSPVTRGLIDAHRKLTGPQL